MRYRVITDTVTNEVAEFSPDWEPMSVVCESGVIIPWERVQRLVPVRGD